ncbi:MAG: hypothetical protein J0H80_25505 [Rhizobiales bacterium]|nr:hypothetical protein [Hyphomicrobiales bacterium]
MGSDMLPEPEYARNMRLIGFTEMDGRPDGVQIMINKGHAIVGHMFSQGFSVIDVRDPRRPRPVNYIPSPPNTWTLHLQAHDDLLLVVNAKDLYRDAVLMDERKYYTGSMRDKLSAAETGYSAGMRVYDIKDPANPREIGFMPVDGVGVHRIWYVGGRWAYMSAMLDGFSDFIFLIVDMSDPARPVIAGKYWLPGMNTAAGERPAWDDRKFRYSCHHGLVAGDTAYVTWRDGGITLLDIADKGAPRLISHRNWCPPYGGGTHNALPLVDRDLLVVLDEAVLTNCADGEKRIWMFDIREPANPVSISTMPAPQEADYIAKGGHFGPHNLHENRPGSFVSSETIFATYNNAGVRAYDIRDPYRPVEIGAFVPAAPRRILDHRPGIPPVLHTNDVFADANGLLYVSDMNAGLSIVEWHG